MLISVETHNGLPIYDQIVRQIKFRIAAEAVRSGELIPSVRELAKQIAVNPNTVARAYRELQGHGVIESVRGKGLAVTSGATERCRKERQDLIRTRLRDVLTEASRSGLTPVALRELTEEELTRLTKSAGEPNDETSV